jgi:serine/threonine-protein kinase
LLSLLGFWVVDGWLFVESEMADTDLGSELHLAINNSQAGLDPITLGPWFRDAAEGLDHLQSLNPSFTHGDIKPGNLLLLGGRCKIGDFGSLHPTGTEDLFRVKGTTQYFAAPETENGISHPNSDQFSLALTYCLLRGVALLTEDEKNDGRKLGEKLGASNLSKTELRSLFKALQTNPAERHGSCSAMVHSLFP